MKLRFSWEKVDERAFPLCSIVDADDGSASPLSCLLMDDGGLSLADTVEWIDVGLETSLCVLNGKTDAGEWNREDWGANVELATTTIYSLHDGSFKETLKTSNFMTVLSAWKIFISSQCNTEFQGQYTQLTLV